MDELEGLRKLLERYVTPLIARSMLQKALRDRGLTAEQLKTADVLKLRPALEQGIGLFVRDVDRERAKRELAELCQRSQPVVKAKSVVVRSEHDISVARQEARRICEELAAASYAVQKVTTIVSELARNMLSYAGGGTLEITPLTGSGRRVVIRAVDSGTGIPNLELVLSGRYQSKTGLGRGLVGTKRLADNFAVATGASGTTVVTEVRV